MTRRTTSVVVNAAILAIPLLLMGCPPLTVEPGIDLYKSVPDNAKGTPPQVQIETSILKLDDNPLPADFFGAGSNPFSDPVPLVGSPLGTTTECNGDIGNTDTIVRRNQAADVQQPGSSDTVDIQLVELSLKSTEPIIVTYGTSTTEQWDVQVGLTPGQPSMGSMTINRTMNDGGTFDAQIDLYARIIFTRLSNPTTKTMDIEDNVIAEREPWIADLPTLNWPKSCTSNFVPGIGRIPVLGRLFRKPVRYEGAQLLIMVRPTIIREE